MTTRGDQEARDAVAAALQEHDQLRAQLNACCLQRDSLQIQVRALQEPQGQLDELRQQRDTHLQERQRQYERANDAWTALQNIVALRDEPLSWDRAMAKALSIADHALAGSPAPAAAPEEHVHDFEPDGRCRCGEHIVPHLAHAADRPATTPGISGVAGLWAKDDLLRLALVLSDAKMTLGQLLDEMRDAAQARADAGVSDTQQGWNEAHVMAETAANAIIERDALRERLAGVSDEHIDREQGWDTCPSCGGIDKHDESKAGQGCEAFELAWVTRLVPGGPSERSRVSDEALARVIRDAAMDWGSGEYPISMSKAEYVASKVRAALATPQVNDEALARAFLDVWKQWLPDDCEACRQRRHATGEDGVHCDDCFRRTNETYHRLQPLYEQVRAALAGGRDATT